jgi:hypothetical protein
LVSIIEPFRAMKLSTILADLQRLIIASLVYYSAIKQLLALACAALGVIIDSRMK